MTRAMFGPCRDAKILMSTASPKPVPPTEQLAKLTVDAKTPQTAAPASVSNKDRPACIQY